MPPEQILRAYAEAVYARDTQALLALYHPQVTVYDLWEHWQYDGLNAWRGMIEGWFASLGEERVQVTFDDIRTHVTPDMALVHAFATYAGLSASGERLRAMNNRLSLTLTRSGDQWLILHEHSSAPADFETGKVNLHRPA
ncbi:nuclear transport factor 2 family protein [Deinococcus sp. 12RED42]|uniref:YybH family protein n=1 Tax=Deinococcus sp. 12RED42 TaxID=2745872 RepID=UPI001E428386|nr:nuclear transport factor 2 family protein [Deinococcus sp. 12RED42]MCD0164834.1 nuclear transport factor 2 family protein [Deinococcus sp. 12RED42]